MQPFNIMTASQLNCVLDCDPATGLKVGGGTPTNNDTKINNWLATATATNPLQLILDGYTSTAGILLPAGGNVEIRGIGMYASGFFMASGSNQHCIRNHPSLPAEGGTQGAVGGPIKLSNFSINGNRGNGTTGNCNTGDPRGTAFWISNIDIFSISMVNIEDLYLYDAPTYTVRLNGCTNHRIAGCVMLNPHVSAVGGPYNNDCIHIHGPSTEHRFANLSLDNNYSDDAIALNAPEGYGGSIINTVINNLNVPRAYCVMRTYCGTFFVTNTHLSGFNAKVSNAGFLLGVQFGVATPAGGQTIATDQLSDVSISDGTIQTFGSGLAGIAVLCNSVGTLRFHNIKIDSPTTAVPFFSLANTPLNVSEAILSNITFYRSTAGSTLAGALFDGNFNAGSGTTNACIIKRLVIDGYNITDMTGQTYSAIPFLLRVPTGCSIGELYIKSLDLKNIALLVDAVNGFTNITQINGPGVAASGFQIPDSVMADNCQYISATGANAGHLCIKFSGVVNLIK